MINDLDRTVEELIKTELAPRIEHLEVSFAAPDSDFHKTITPPAVDLFLYDIRENMELRDAAWIVERQFDRLPNGEITEKAFRKRAPVRVDCSYLITAWSGDGSKSPALEEHLLLSEVMKVLLRYPTIPDVMLQGSLKGQEPPLPAATLQPGRLQSVGEFWQALGGKPKAALNYTVTIGVMPDRAIEAEVPVLDKRLQFSPAVQR